MSAENKRLVLSSAAVKNHHSVVAYLCPQVASVISAEDKKPVLNFSVKSGHLAVVEYLYPQIVSVMSAEDKKRMLGVAAQAGHLQIIKCFLEQHGDDFEIECIQQALEYAKSENDSDMVNYLKETLTNCGAFELTGAVNNLELTPQFKHSRKQDENNQAPAPECEAAYAVKSRMARGA